MRHLAFFSSLLKVLSEIQELLGMWLAALNISVWSGTVSISYWRGHWAKKNIWCWLLQHLKQDFPPCFKSSYTLEHQFTPDLWSLVRQYQVVYNHTRLKFIITRLFFFFQFYV